MKMKKNYEEIRQLIDHDKSRIHFVDELLSVKCMNTDSVRAILNVSPSVGGLVPECCTKTKTNFKKKKSIFLNLIFEYGNSF